MQTIKKIAFVCALGIGDALLSMTVVTNLRRHGYTVTIFTDHLLQLQQWFPAQLIKPFPNLEQAQTLFQEYDKIISTDAVPLVTIKEKLGEKYHIIYRKQFNKNKSVVLNIWEGCQKLLPLSEINLQNDIVIAPDLQHRQFLSRVLIHPTSSNIKKNWPAEKFITLAMHLQKKNLQPVFVVSPAEHDEWQAKLQNQFALPLFSDLDCLARFVYESGYMVGNDSGIGHLAANLGLPTLTLYARKSVANLWRPIWGKNIAVTPTITLPSGTLRMKYWQQLLTVKKVLKNFETLLKYDVKSRHD